MNKSFKRFISTMLVACMAMSMTAGAVGTEKASEAETNISIIESSRNEEAGTSIEIS